MKTNILANIRFWAITMVCLTVLGVGNAWGYTVTFSTGSGNPTVDAVAEASNNAGITLPAGVTPVADGWVFVGWATASCSESTKAPVLYLAGTEEYKPGANITMYAVYRKYTSGTSSVTFNAANISNLTVHPVYARDWTDNTAGIDLYLSAGQRYTGGTPNTWTVTKSTDQAGTADDVWNYILLTAYRKISQIDVVLSGTSYKIEDDGTGIESDADTDDYWAMEVSSPTAVEPYTQTVSYTGDVDDFATQVWMFATTAQQIRAKTIEVTYYNAKFCSEPCDNIVSLSYNSAGSSNVSAMTFSTTSVATCSSTAGDREVTVTVTPSSGYFMKSGDRLTWSKTSGTIPADPVYVSGPTDNGNGTWSFVYRFAQDDNGAGTFAAAASTLTNYRTVCSTTYDITLDKNGGDADGSAKVALNGTQLTNISAPTKTGYKVDGYYAESGKTNLVAATDGTLEKSVEISSTDWTNSDGEWVKGDDATLYAKWEPISYSVRFNKNNGSATGTMSNESYDYDESKALTSNAFSLTGYTFAGWATTSDGSVAHTDGKSVSNLSSTDGAVVDLYAVWTANKYTLTLAATNETSSVGSQTVQATYGSSMPLVTTADKTPAVAALSRTGYTFDGWEYSSTQYYSYNAGTSTLSSAHVWDIANSTTTLTPRWNVNSYTLTWDKNGGNALTGDYTSGSVNYGATITAPNTPTRSGYDFAGWDDGSGVVTPATTMPAGDVTYTATWTKKSASGWTWTYNSAAIPDPLVLYVGINKTLDITWDPSDLLSEKKGYTVTKTDSKVAQGGKGNDYYTMRGAAGVTEVTNTTVTFSLSGLSDVEVNVTVKPQPRVHFVDKIHGESFDDLLPTVVSYVATFVKATPTHSDVSDPGSNYNTCERQHLHLVGWILSTWADANPGASPSQITGAGSGKYYAAGADINVETHDGDTFYAVWSKVE